MANVKCLQLSIADRKR